jgi:hypothetical protein
MKHMTKTDLVRALKGLLKASKDVEERLSKQLRRDPNSLRLHQAILHTQRVLTLKQREKMLKRSKERSAYAMLLPAVDKTGRSRETKPKRRHSRQLPKERKVSR